MQRTTKGDHKMANPVHKENGKWYFWDETGAGRCGPYKSKKDAQIALSYYSETTLAPKGTQFKHCGTCKHWTPEETDKDVGACEAESINLNSIDPPIGGIAIHGEYYTHAVYGCVNHKPS
jgi:hypothetical protein